MSEAGGKVTSTVGVIAFLFASLGWSETLDSYVAEFDADLSACFRNTEDLRRALDDFEDTVDSYVDSASVLADLADRSLAYEYLTLFSPESIPARKSGVARACWMHFYEFKKQLSDRTVNKTQILRDWRVCLTDLYREVPPPAKKLVQCYERLDDLER